MSTDTRHGFEDGTYVTFQGVKGMEEVNDREFKINVPSMFLKNVIFFWDRKRLSFFKVHLHLQLAIQQGLECIKEVEQ